VTVPGAAVLFTRVWVMLFPLPSANPDAVPEVNAAVQINVDPATDPFNNIDVEFPEHTDCDAGVAVTVGVG
jgi:hypothetical protein